MAEDAEMIDEVVVTALGIKREEKALGYAVQKVGGSKLSTVKPVNIATSLTGKVAGLNVTNSTEFNTAPTLKLRGETPLLVVDGVPYSNISLNDIAADDIESVDVLKGATASALYGARGGSGAIMVTTKKGSQEGLNISVNSSTMFNAGYLVLPEVQHGYSTGQGGKYTAADFVWGDKLDIGLQLYSMTRILMNGKRCHWYRKVKTTLRISWRQVSLPIITSASARPVNMEASVLLCRMFIIKDSIPIRD